jgi:uncharacterized damage-inducible protein DinB
VTLPDLLHNELKASEEFFERSTRVLQEEHSAYTPAEGQYTVAAQVAHAALTIHWFLEGAFGAGFDMNFEEHERQARAVTSLAEARAMLAGAFQKAYQATQQYSEADWNADFPEGALIQGPKTGVVFGIVEHTSHHRGALAVYSRLLGLQPLLPYMEIPG